MTLKNICRFISVAFCAATFCVLPARAKLATVGAVHDYVKQKWAIEIPHTHATSNLINMSYLMQLVDAANLALNGFITSDYADDATYATSSLAGTIVARDATETLIEKVEWKFFFTPATSASAYSFSISAAGRFYIDWGDGNKEFIHKKDVNTRTISHTYADGMAANTHDIKLGGKASAYSTGETTAAISFSSSAAKLRAFSGCLGCVFSTIDDKSVAANQRQPRFYSTFEQNTALAGEIPAELFNGIHGAPASKMFRWMFDGCSNLTGSIPENLFAQLDGAPTTGLFDRTFSRCPKLTGSIPENLFKTIKGQPAAYMFSYTFQGSTGLTGSIPEKLFAGIEGAPAEAMFYGTFRDCTGLTGQIPEKLFTGIPSTGPYVNFMFSNTFYKCTGLTGPSVKLEDMYLYEIWPDAHNSPANVGDYTYEVNTYRYAANLSDYACIPTSWGGAGTKQPGECEPAVDTDGDDD